jgi:hypothetical protein
MPIEFENLVEKKKYLFYLATALLMQKITKSYLINFEYIYL